MAFTINDCHDLVQLVDEHPEWRRELRQLLLPEELLELPHIVRELAERVNQLTEAQGRTEETLRRVADGLNALADAQRRTEERLDQLVGITSSGV